MTLKIPLQHQNNEFDPEVYIRPKLGVKKGSKRRKEKNKKKKMELKASSTCVQVVKGSCRADWEICYATLSSISRAERVLSGLSTKISSRPGQMDHSLRQSIPRHRGWFSFSSRIAAARARGRKISLRNSQ